MGERKASASWRQLKITKSACTVFRLIAPLAIMALLSSWPAFAQRITGTLSGTVADPSGAVIADATVKIVNEETLVPSELKTNQAGRFIAPALPPGHYSVQINATGFKQLEQHDIKLLVDQTLDLPFSLSTGAVTDKIVVTAEQPLINSETSDTGAVIETKEILNLPLNDRNPYSLVLLTPGVTGATSEYFAGMQFNVNGGRKGSTDILLNGVSSTPPTDGVKMMSVFPSVDAVQEFKVQTSNYSSEFGQTGGGIINVVFKSGTDKFHGSAYEFLRNSALDANNFFANAKGIALGSFKKNQFGGTIGGPVVLPKLYDGHQKTFFFFSYEGLRQRQQSVLSTTVPTLAMRQGDFSGLTTKVNGVDTPVTIYDPTTTQPGTYKRTPFANNTIPANRINPVAAKVIQYYPLPNIPGTSNNYMVSVATPSSTDQVDAKVDENLTDKQHLSVSFSMRNPYNGVPPYFPAPIMMAENQNAVRVNAIGGTANYMYTVSPTDLFEVRYGQYGMNYKTIMAGDGFDPTQLGLPAYMAANTQGPLQFPAFNLSGYVTIGSGNQGAEGSAKYSTQSWIVTNTKMFTKHTLKTGFETRFLRNKNNQVGMSSGNFTFSKSLTQGPVGSTSSTTAGDAFASLLLGVGTGTVTQNFKLADTSSRYLAGYVQDDWKVLPRLTLNVGVRYELYQPRTEVRDRASWFDPTAASPLAQNPALTGLNLHGSIIYPGVNRNPHTQTDIEYGNIAPRVGLAFMATHHLAIRAAWGMFYANAPNQAAATIAQYGYRTDTTYTGTTDNGITQRTISDPFPGGVLISPSGSALGGMTGVGAGITTIMRHSPTPYSEQTMLDLQYVLPKNWVLDVAYVGTRGLQLIHSYSANQLPDQYLSMGSQLIQQVTNPFYGVAGIPSTSVLAKAKVEQRYLLTPYPQFTGVSVMYAPGSYSKYDALQMQLQKQLDKHLSVRVAFTGSKFMDNNSSSSGNFGGNGTSQDASNLKSDWSLSTADVPRYLSASAVYQLPFGRGQRFGASWGHATEAALGGWKVNTILNIQSGTPLGVSMQNSNLQNFGPGQRANWNGHSPHLDGELANRLTKNFTIPYFDTSAFSAPASYTFGNTTRTLPYLRAPGVRNVDLSLFKEFQVLEQLKAQLRVEAFNAFNTPRFGSPNTQIGNANFGQITSQANQPRQMQIALKLLF